MTVVVAVLLIVAGLLAVKAVERTAATSEPATT